MSKEAIQHYESALKEAFPSGATGDVFFHWNEARKALADQPAQPLTEEENSKLFDLLIEEMLAHSYQGSHDYAEKVAIEIRRMYKAALREALAEQPAQQEPVAWRYTDARGYYRYRGFVADFDKEYPMLKPQALYTTPQAQPDRVRQAIAEAEQPAQTCSRHAEVERLADLVERHPSDDVELVRAAAELRRLVSFNNDLMDEVARLNKAVVDERGACADAVRFADNGTEAAAIIRARENT